MTTPVFIGDRLTAAGFRLAGLRTLVTAPEDALKVFRDALSRHGAILITASLAARLPAGVLEKAVSAASPPVAVVPDFSGGREPADLAHRVRRALGVET
ncbi:MAG: V-type ATP synthase subunit F [Gammaproteobacteria bacterium]